MSWIFLTDEHAWKLKKPVRYEFLNFSTVEARRIDCNEEVRLNRRLAADVYLGVVPLTVVASGAGGNGRNLAHKFVLGGAGEPVDWLVQMRRLPADRMLDRQMAERRRTDADVRKAAILLARFYRAAAPVPMTAAGYRAGLRRELDAARQELGRSAYGLDPTLVQAATATAVALLESNAAQLGRRAEAGRIVEAHGDLRAEHICLEDPPVIIDCLEFNRDLRILDPASELTFIALDCERLGDAPAGRIFLDVYRQETGDAPEPGLLACYKAYHACLRAKIAIWHLRDDGGDAEHWRRRAEDYLRLAASISAAG